MGWLVWPRTGSWELRGAEPEVMAELKLKAGVVLVKQGESSGEGTWVSIGVAVGGPRPILWYPGDGWGFYSIWGPTTVIGRDEGESEAEP